ncbi:hypothetical protein A176_000042 [Myxococcus hansupus]|uniref:Glutamate synthase [NADPH] large chain n=1 Tax=Pseudomyxococcus hansupus TaxID=1297742 RepID=A0A0H4WP78_9BACT|nr:hypothetical protein A176_000042 [Myxococcus hansupus]
MVAQLLTGGVLRGNRRRAEQLSRCLMQAPVPETIEALLDRLYAAPSYGKDGVFGDETSAFALVRLALHLFGPPTRTASVPGDLVVSNHREGAVRSPLWIPGHLNIEGSLDVDEGAWLLCTGDVRVGGATVDYEPGSIIAVGGSLSTARMSTLGAVVIGGNLDVADTLLAWRNDERLVVEQTLRAGLLVACDHTVVAAHVDAVRLDSDAEGSLLHQYLRDEVLTGAPGDLRLDVEAADQWIRRNASPRR